MNKKIVLISVIGLLAVALTLLLFNNDNKQDVAVVKELDVIDKYGYILYDNKTDLYKEKFGELKEILSEDNVDYLAYAKKIAELFVADFYDLNSKKTNTDIGGVDFIYKSAKDEFILKAQDTIYKYVENNVYGKREQQLPSVIKANADLVTEEAFESQKVTDLNAYKIKVDIDYKKDLEYPNSVTLVLVHDENKVFIVEIK